MFPLSFFNLGKLIVIKIVLRIHLNHLSFGWSTHDFYDFDQMIDTTLTYKQGNSV